MKDKAFLDTNILVYLYSEDEVQKRAIACTAIETYILYYKHTGAYRI
jgi:predicted nucleic acid-binding protein